jgi:hypothetical protein
MNLNGHTRLKQDRQAQLFTKKLSDTGNWKVTLECIHRFVKLRLTLSSPSVTTANSTFCQHSAFVFLIILTTVVSLYSINWMVFIIETECLYCAGRTETLDTIQANLWPLEGEISEVMWQMAYVNGCRIWEVHSGLQFHYTSVRRPLELLNLPKYFMTVILRRILKYYAICLDCRQQASA